MAGVEGKVAFELDRLKLLITGVRSSSVSLLLNLLMFLEGDQAKVGLTGDEALEFVRELGADSRRGGIFNHILRSNSKLLISPRIVRDLVKVCLYPFLTFNMSREGFLDFVGLLAFVAFD
jgi:hypothetical protein